MQRSNTSDPTSLTNVNQDRSPFLKLPAEIRVRIYEFALGGHDVWVPYAHEADVTPKRVARYVVNPAAMRTFSSVTMTCRAMQAETDLIMYSANVFGSGSTEVWRNWFNSLGEQKRAAIRTIEIYPDLGRMSKDFYTRILRELPNLKLMIVKRSVVVPSVEEDLVHRAREKGCQLIFEDF